MNDLPILPLADAALRGALIALLLLMAVRLARDRPDAPAARVGAALMIGLVVQVFASLPMVEASAPLWWQAPLVGVSVGNSVLFWVFAASLFDDDFALRRRHVGAWAAVVALGIVFYVVVVMPQRQHLEVFPLLVAIAMRWTPIAFAGLAVFAVAAEWRADLVERRRLLRVFVLTAGAVYTLVTGAARIASADGRLSAWMSGLDIALLLVIVGTIAPRVLRVVDTELIASRAARVGGVPVPSLPTLAPPAPVAVATAANPVDRADPIDPADPAEDRLEADLHRLMTEQNAYRTENLTIASLSGLLKTPEYRVRRLINQRLGHRNFNAFVNGYRLAEAQRSLSDPAKKALPVLTIALDAGFQSIGPFNRAFKLATGLTPTDYRREHLADS